MENKAQSEIRTTTNSNHSENIFFKIICWIAMLGSWFFFFNINIYIS